MNIINATNAMEWMQQTRQLFKGCDQVTISMTDESALLLDLSISQQADIAYALGREVPKDTNNVRIINHCGVNLLLYTKHNDG